MRHQPYDPKNNPDGYLPPQRIPRIDGYRLQALLADGSLLETTVVGWQDNRARVARLKSVTTDELQGWFVCRQETTPEANKQTA